MDPHSRAPKKNTSHGKEVLPQDTTHLIQRPCYQEEVCAKIQQAIRPYEDLLTIIKRHKLQWYGHISHSSGLAKTIMQGTVKGGRKTGQTEEKVERQYQGMDRPGVRQVPEGSREQGYIEETACEIICGGSTRKSVPRSSSQLDLMQIF